MASESEFDALTDLFLGEIGGSAPADTERSSEAPADPQQQPATVQPTTAPRLRLCREFDDDLPLPEPAISPLRAAEVDPFNLPVSRPNTPPTAETPEPPLSTNTQSHRATDPIVECVILGNLPVLGSLWATQYVREVAQAAGRPIAVLRVQNGFASVEIVNADDELLRRTPQAFESLGLALRKAADLTDRWILRCDPGDEAAAAGRSVVRVVTLLTGADEAARVGAYASIKDLAEHLPPPGEEANSRPPLLMRLAVMGAAADRARELGGRISEAVATFLKRDIERVACASRIGSSRPPVLLFSGPTNMNAAGALDALEHSLGGGDRAAPVPVASNDHGESGSIATDAPAESHGPHLNRNGPAPLDQVLGERETAPITATLDQSHPDAETPEIEPAVVEHVAPPQDPPVRVPAASTEAWQTRRIEQSERSDLASFVPGLVALPMRCPYSESVELAADRSGGLHLLVRATWSGPGSEERAFASLLVASSWADSHAALLGSAARETELRPSRPVLHLFTDDPKRSRRLLDTELRVHLLAQVSAGDRTAWYCTELN